MNLRHKSVAGGRFEDAGRLLDREEALVAEDIDILGQPLAGHGREHFAADEVYVLCLAPDVGAPNGVRPEEGGAHLERCRLADAADDAQHLQLVLGREAVAALDFHGAGAHADDFADALHRLAVELLLGGGVEPVGGVENTPAAARYLFVAQAVDFVEELLLAAAGIDQMGVRVAERREEHPPGGIHHLCGVGTPLGHRPEGGDAPLLGQQPGGIERLQTSHLLATQTFDAFRLDSDNRSDVLNQQSHDASFVLRMLTTATPPPARCAGSGPRRR